MCFIRLSRRSRSKLLGEICGEGAKIIESFCLAGLERTMNQFNKKEAKKKATEPLSIKRRQEDEPTMRVDKWLWRCVSLRPVHKAADACKMGRDQGVGVPWKPAPMVEVGDTIQVRKPPLTLTYKIKAITNNRIGAGWSSISLTSRQRVSMRY